MHRSGTEADTVKLRFRRYESDGDYWRMREFLRQVFLLNDRHQWSWHVARLDYARWHTCLNIGTARLQDVAFLWEEQGQGSGQGRIAAVLIADGGPGEAHLLVHPYWRTPQLDREMLDVAEERLTSADGEGSRKLYVWTPEQDKVRRGLLGGRGYTDTNSGEHQWRRSLQGPLPDAPVAAGYSIRALAHSQYTTAEEASISLRQQCGWLAWSGFWPGS